MSNVLLAPSLGKITFDSLTAGVSTQSALTASSQISYDGLGGINITSYNTAGTERLSVDGVNGRLFTVSDVSSGSIFSINDISGLPIIDVNTGATDVIKIGTYGTNALVINDTKVGIGTATPSQALQVVGNILTSGSVTAGLASFITLGATASTTPLTITGSINNFFELNLQNTSSGAAASSDLVITANTGTSSTNFIDLGINGSAFSGAWGGALDGYLYASDNNMWVGTNTAGKNLYLSAGNAGATAIITVGSSLVTVAQTLSTASGRLKNISVKTTNYTLVSTDHIIVGNSASTFTLTLPAASSNTSREYIIKNKGTATVTVDATGLGLVDGQNTTTVTQYSAITLISDGTTWNVF